MCPEWSQSRRILIFSIVFALGAIGWLFLFTPPHADAASKQGGKIIFAARQDIDTLDPQATYRAATRKILLQFLDTLVVINPQDGKIYPGLAESWEVSQDGKAFTFRLRRNVKFHDGTPFDASAVKFTLDRTQEPANAGGVARSFLGPYEGSEVLDAQTVRIRFKQSYAPFLRMVGLAPFGIVSPAAAKSMGQDFGRRPVGTGPFIVKEWLAKDHVTLVRNPDYNWASPVAKHQGPAYLDEIVWRFVLEPTTRTAVLQTGEVNISEDLSYADVAALEKNPEIRILRGTPAGTPWAIFPNVQRFPTNELAVRKALHHALNKDAIVRVVFQGQSQPAWSPLQPTMPGHWPAAKGLFPYDPGRATKLLDEAGWKPGADGIRLKDGKRLELLWIFGTNDGYEEMAPLIQAMAREVGIDIQLREEPRSQMEAANQKGEHHIGEINWWFSDPSILTTIFHSNRLSTPFNRARLGNAQLDALLDRGSATVEERARMEIYKRIQETIMELAAEIPLVDQVTVVGVRKEVKDYRFNIVTFPVLYDVYLEK